MKEFEIIERFFKPLASNSESLNLADDAAFVVEAGQVICKDILVEDIHFFKTDYPSDIARKALRVNISDCAAMGASPEQYLLGLALPQEFANEEWLQSFHNGLNFEQEESKITLIGGDTTSSDKLMISITMLANCDKPVLRSTAKPEQDIYITGNIGDSGLGLRILQGKLASPESWVNRQLANNYNIPPNRVKIAQQLSKFMTSCADVSDGLLLDIANICNSSQVAANLNLGDIPISEAAQNCLLNNDVEKLDLLNYGDDYELLFTADKKHSKEIMAMNSINCTITKIGETAEGNVIKVDGKLVDAKGYEH